MINPNNLEESKILTLTENRKRYNLQFTEFMGEKIRDFCQTFSIELNKFIVNTVGYYLFIIEDDIASNAYDLIGGYFDAPKFRSEQSTVKDPEGLEKKMTIEIKFPQLISNAIKDLCNEIPPTPEEFIEGTLKWSIKDIIAKIKKGEYDFLDKYKDFSKVQKSIQKIYNNDLL